MKRFIIWSSVALLLVAIGIIVARADGSRRHGWGGRGWSHHGPLGYVAHALNLSDAQKSQIKSMWDAERPTVASLVQELASEGMLGGLTGSFFSFIGYNMFPAKGPGPSSFALARSHY